MSRGRGVGRVLCGGGDEIIWLSIDIRNGTCALEKHTSDDKLPLRGGEHASEPRRPQLGIGLSNTLVDGQLDGHDAGFASSSSHSRAGQGLSIQIPFV